MKIKLLLSLFVVVLSYSTAYASFPVKSAISSTENAEITTSVNSEEEAITSAAAPMAQKKLSTALLLYLFLGWPFAAHRWYLGSPWYWNVLFILTIGGLGVWAIIDLIDIATEKYPGL